MTEAERKLFMKFVWINVVLFSIMFIIIPLIFGIIPYYLVYEMNPEILSAILSLEIILGKGRFKVLKSHIAEALKLEKRLDDLVLKVLKQEPVEMESPIKLSDAAELRDAVISLNIATLLEDIMPKLEDQGVGLETGTKLADILAYLQEVVPPVEGQSLMNKFVWRCRVIDNPLWVLKLISENQLTGIEVEALSAAYPALYEGMIGTFVEKITEEFTDIQDLPRNTRLMLAGLMGVPALDQKTLMAYSESEKPNPVSIQTPKGK